MTFVRTHVDGSRTRVYTEKSITSGNASATRIAVSNVAELEAAVTAQTAGQFIYIKPGTYNLTAMMTIPLAADGGGLFGVGNVTINGLDGVDAAIKIDSSDTTGTFEYTFGGMIIIKGGSGKDGLQIVNGATTEKTIIYIKDEVFIEDNGAGEAVVITNTGTGALRFYVTCRAGTGWDTVNITPKTANDRFRFRGINFEAGFSAAVVSVACTFHFQDCQIVHAGMDGGHATNVVNVVNCFTIETTAVAVVDAADFPNAFSATIIPIT